jgi:hypothetical protein
MPEGDPTGGQPLEDTRVGYHRRDVPVAGCYATRSSGSRASLIPSPGAASGGGGDCGATQSGPAVRLHRNASVVPGLGLTCTFARRSGVARVRTDLDQTDAQMDETQERKRASLSLLPCASRGVRRGWETLMCA